jgi:isopenicillin-N epimerase
MGIAPLPTNTDLVVLKTRLYDEFHVEVPLVDWNGQKFVRISVQGYNTQSDLDALCQGLSTMLDNL